VCGCEGRPWPGLWAIGGKRLVWEVMLERENKGKCMLERESSVEREMIGFWGSGECSKVEERERFLVIPLPRNTYLVTYSAL